MICWTVPTVYFTHEHSWCYAVHINSQTQQRHFPICIHEKYSVLDFLDIWKGKNKFYRCAGSLNFKFSIILLFHLSSSCFPSYQPRVHSRYSLFYLKLYMHRIEIAMNFFISLHSHNSWEFKLLALFIIEKLVSKEILKSQMFISTWWRLEH